MLLVKIEFVIWIDDILQHFSSCVVGSAASVASQVVAGDSVRLDPVLAFGLYG